MNNQATLRAILKDIQETRGLLWHESKEYACKLLKKSPATMDTWLTKGRDIPDNELRLLQLLTKQEMS